ncbi:MAG TPA: molybdopterin synthase sulfur carrier subunit [Syntrophomonas sp.]|jgi:sulfur carrier protein|nr:molybdopterin synthase sulfur carrier subunit [Syntrophomonas sp.]
MKITVKLFANLRKGRFKVNDLEFPEGTNVLQVLNDLSIDAEEMKIGIIFVNGRHASFDTVLKEQDVLAIFPPVAGG